MRATSELVPWMRARGGVAHTSDLRAAGFTTHAIRTASADGRAHWVRRSWLAAADAHPELRRAAAAGGRVTCLSAARQLGLWTPDHHELHIAVPHSASRIDASGLRIHWGAGPEPAPRTALRDPMLNVLFHVATCVPFVDALCVWESALRTRSVDAGVLTQVRWRGEARAIAAQASTLSDSGLETRFVVLVRRLGVAVRQQVWIDGHPVDALIGERLVVQIDGFAHHQAADRRRDLRADARLVLLGYTVLRFDYVQILFHPDEVIAVISAALAQGRHEASARR